MQYKTIMLDREGYARLAQAKRVLRRRSGLKLSFNDVIGELAGHRLEFSDMDEELRAYIMEFAGKAAKLEQVEGVLLFGSVAKGTYNEYSDIDVLIVAGDGKVVVLKEILGLTAGLARRGRKLMERGMPSLISPVILNARDLREFRPFYFDFADYGMILYERNNILTDFIYSIRKMKHRRESVNNVEVITWQGSQ
jgi:predicted nucleotidyltransferase